MSDQTKTYKPTHLAYVVREFKTKEGEAKSDWKEIGAAWAHKDGKGYDVQLEAVPVNEGIAWMVR